jgi:hypothetical protein
VSVVDRVLAAAGPPETAAGERAPESKEPGREIPAGLFRSCL